MCYRTLLYLNRRIPKKEPGVGGTLVIPALGRWRQWDDEIEASLCYILRSCLNKQTPKKEYLHLLGKKKRVYLGGSDFLYFIQRDCFSSSFTSSSSSFSSSSYSYSSSSSSFFFFKIGIGL
jgi:hypothetical protein